MAQRVGLDRQAVVATALAIVDQEDVRALTLARVAQELGVRTPSLYNHVDGQRGLRRELWIHVVLELGDVLRSSILGRSGEDALFSFATALRGYALRHPGRYQLTLIPDGEFDDEMRAARDRSAEAFRALIRSFGLDESQARHAGRAFRAAVHGFVVLEAQDALGSGDLDGSFHELVSLLALGLQPAAARGDLKAGSGSSSAPRRIRAAGG